MINNTKSEIFNLVNLFLKIQFSLKIHVFIQLNAME